MAELPTPVTDERIAYGANCTWWGAIQDVGRRQSGPYSLPCCPICGGMLFEVPSEDRWWAQAELYERDGHPGYRDFLHWLRGRCLPNLTAATRQYEQEKLARG